MATATIDTSTISYRLQHAVFESLYLSQQHKFYNNGYKLQALMSSAFILSVVYTNEYNWSRDMADGLQSFFHIWQLPLYLVPESGHDLQLVIFGIATGWFVVLVALLVALSRSRVHSSSHIQRMIAVYRALLGFGMTFWITPLRVWLVWVDCDYFGDKGGPIGIVSPNNQLTTSDEAVVCFRGVVMTVLGVASLILVMIWFAVLAIGSLAHVNNPRSWSIAARPHSWCDALNVMTAYPIVFVTIILNGRIGVYLGIAIFLTRGFLSAFTILLQPYYNFGFNDFRAGLFTGEAWAGIALIIVSASSNPASTEFTIVSLVLYVVCAIGGCVASRLGRRWLLGKVKEEYAEYFSAMSSVEAWRDASQNSAHLGDTDGMAFSPPSNRKVLPREVSDAQNKSSISMKRVLDTLDDDNDVRRNSVWGIIAEEVVPGVTQGPFEWFRAVQAEVKTRFILEGKTNRRPHKVLLDIAENILLRGMQASVQSSYLQLQYIVFLASYRENYEQSKLQLDSIERTMNVNLGLQYSIYRKRKDLDRLRQERESQNQDQGISRQTAEIGYEEIQKREALASEEHEKCKRKLLLVWKAIRRFQQGTEDEQHLSALLQAAARSELFARDAFIYVLSRCQDAEVIYRRFALFLSEIQHDTDSAIKMVECADSINVRAKSTGESKSQGSQSRTSNNQDFDPNRLFNESKPGFNNVWLTFKLRGATLLLIAAIGTLLINYTLSISNYQETLMNINESGMRRVYAMEAVYGARKMHVAAVTYYQLLNAQPSQTSEMLIEGKASMKTTLKAFREFSQAWNDMPPGTRTVQLQSAYITENPYPIGQKDLLVRADGPLPFNDVHERYFSFFHDFLVEHGLYDIFLFDLNGNVIDTVYKELDFATNFLTGPWRETMLADLFKATKSSGGKTIRCDFAPYEPSYFILAGFITTGIFDENGALVGVLAFQLNFASMALQDSLKNYKSSAENVRVAMDSLWEAHNNLVYKYESSYKELIDFNREAQPDVILYIPIPSQTSEIYRPIAVSASDAGWRLISSAREMLGEPMARFGSYDKRIPESNIPMSFVLENTIMVARAMDQCTAVLQLEASYIATSLRLTFIVLVALAALIEIVLVVVIFRRAINDEFRSFNESIRRLKELSPELISTNIAQLTQSIAKTAQAVKKDEATRAPRFDDDNSESGFATDSDTTVSDDDEDGQRQGDDVKHTRSAHLLSGHASDADDDKEGVSQARQRFFLSLFYYGCMAFICIVLGILCYLCIRVVDSAEAASGEINNSGRRMYLARRMVYLAFELVHAGPLSVSLGEALIGSGVTWVRSLEIIRCQLDRNVLAMLSVHYALLYGKRAGWADMAGSFERGPIREWGQQGSVDMCSPFTWDKLAFQKAMETSGSFGRYSVQDNLLFKSNCLTEIPEADIPKSSMTFTDSRIATFSASFIGGEKLCPLFLQRCRFLDRAQYKALSAAERRIQYSSKTQYVNMPNSDPFFASVPQCENGTDVPTRKSRSTPRPDPCPETPYPSGCYFRTVPEAQCTCRGGEVGPEGCIATAGQERDFPCPDPTASSGLHNFIVTVADKALQLSKDADDMLSESNPNFRFLLDFDSKDFNGGLMAATLIYQQEAMGKIADNSIITMVGFVLAMLIVVGQYFFLGMRLSRLIESHTHIEEIIQRMKTLDDKLADTKIKERMVGNTRLGRVPTAVVTNGKGRS